MNTKSYCDNENMPSQQAEGDGGPSPGERLTSDISKHEG